MIILHKAPIKGILKNDGERGFTKRLCVVIIFGMAFPLVWFAHHFQGYCADVWKHFFIRGL